MLYAVPQTDQVTEDAMALMVTRLSTTLPKPEALGVGAAGGISGATAAQHLADAVGIVTSALGDRVPDGSAVVQWDAALDRAARVLAAVSLYNWRGRNRQAGADESIDREQERTDAYLARLRSHDREEQPVYVVSPAGVDASSPLLSSSPTSSTWTRRRHDGRRGPRGEA